MNLTLLFILYFQILLFIYPGCDFEEIFGFQFVFLEVFLERRNGEVDRMNPSLELKRKWERRQREEVFDLIFEVGVCVDVRSDVLQMVVKRYVCPHFSKHSY